MYPANYYVRSFLPRHLPMTWIFFVTYRCDARCDFCFYWKELSKKAEMLSFEEISRISQGMGHFDHLMISGGEPTLRQDLPEIAGLFFRVNRIRKIHLPSNGIVPERTNQQVKRILEICKGIDLTVGLPLNGLEQTNDSLSGIKGSFRKVQETAKLLSKLKGRFPNLKTYIITTVSSKNYDEVLQLADLVSTLPVDGFGPSPIRGSPKDQALSPPSGNEWTDLIMRLQDRGRVGFYKEKSIKNRFIQNQLRSTHGIFAKSLDGIQSVRCIAGDLIGVMDPNGDIRQCELKGIIGNIRDHGYDVRKILYSDKAIRMKKEIGSCHCTHACFQNLSRDMDPFSLMKSLIGI